MEDPQVECGWHEKFFGFKKIIKPGSLPATTGICKDCEILFKAQNNLEKEAVKMENKDLNIGDILPPNKDVPEKFATSDTVVPDFLKEAAYEPMETMEQTIQEDWRRLAVGLSDYVLAEQITERELLGMGKPVPENYSEYFHATLGEVKKNRKKAEQRLLKLIPRHSQLDACEFFYSLQEQMDKEQEARERAIEVYPFAGVEKLERHDVARSGLKKEAAKECSKCGKVYAEGEAVHEVDGPECKAYFAQKAAEAEKALGDVLKPMEKKAADPILPKIESDVVTPAKPQEASKQVQTNEAAAVCGHCGAAVEPRKGFVINGKVYCMPCHDAGHDTGVLKEAAAKWKPGQHLLAKYNKCAASVLYVNEEDKIYVVKVEGTMYPSYYCFEDAYDTFDAIKPEESKDSEWAKAHGVTKTAEEK